MHASSSNQPTPVSCSSLNQQWQQQMHILREQFAEKEPGTMQIFITTKKSFIMLQYFGEGGVYHFAAHCNNMVYKLTDNLCVNSW